MNQIVNWNTVLASLIYAGLGIFVLLLSFIIIEKLTPQNLWKEVSQNKNVALALLGSAYMIAVAIIIASAIH